MGGITGLNTAVELGFEADYGVAVVPTFKVKHTSEGFKWSPEYKAEETLIGNVTEEDSDLVGCSAEGDLGVMARPGVIGKLAAAALGVDAAELEDGTVGVYKHSITCITPGVNNSLPSLTILVNRHVAVKAYTGMKVASFKLESAPKDFVKATLSFKGRTETAGVMQGLPIPTRKAYKFANGQISIDGTDTSGIVTGFSVGVENNLDDAEPTLESGIYPSEPEFQKRKITVSLETLFRAETEALREAKFKNGAYANILLTLTSLEEIEAGEAFKMVISLPRVRILEAHPAAGDSGKLKVTLSGEAYETTGVEPITIDCYNADAAAYV